MSPSSLVEDVTGELSDGSPPPKRIKLSRPSTRSNVASLIGLQSVTPRSIAYVAVQVGGIVFTVICATDSCWRSCVSPHPVLVAGAWLTVNSITLNSTTRSWVISRWLQEQGPKLALIACFNGGIRKLTMQLSGSPSDFVTVKSLVCADARLVARRLVLALLFQRWPLNAGRRRR